MPSASMLMRISTRRAATKAGVDPTIAARALWLETHPLPTASDETDQDATFLLAGSKRDLWLGKGGPKYKTKPIIVVGAQ